MNSQLKYPLVPFGVHSMSLEQIENVLDKKYRSGWGKYRGIPDKIGETTKEHAENVVLAGKLFVIHNDIGMPQKQFVRMMRFHDVNDWIAPDLIPGEDDENKQSIEMNAVNRLPYVMGPVGVLIKNDWDFFEKQEHYATLIGKDLDEICPGIRAEEYMKIGWQNTADFEPRIKMRMRTTLLGKIYDKVTKREYPDFCSYWQYFNLLAVNGDEKLHDEIMLELHQRRGSEDLVGVYKNVLEQCVFPQKDEVMNTLFKESGDYKRFFVYSPFFRA